jgi:hypothetical protein
MSFTEAQRQTLNELPTGLHLNTGSPCECGAESYSTSSSRKYSDSMVYSHKCGNCGNTFTTWTEG